MDVLPEDPSLSPDPALGDVRVLLIQARNTSTMEEQEQKCFLERCRISADQLTAVNLVHTLPTAELLDGTDALLIGGAGEYSALDTPEWMPPLLDLVREAADRDFPTFGSCWGHQILARAFGGKLVHDLKRSELGACPIELTEAGQADPLFEDCSRRFVANAGHHDRVSTLPDGAVELAFNDSQRNQAFRMRDAPVYGTQFHSELSADRERERLLAYRDYYREDLPTEDAFQHVLNNLVDTSEVDRMLSDFLHLYLA